MNGLICSNTKHRSSHDVIPLSHVAHSCAVGSAHPNALRDKGGCKDTAVNTFPKSVATEGEELARTCVA